MPLVGSLSITYRRSLELFAPFTLTTRTLCWDEKWFYMEQVFRANARGWRRLPGSRACSGRGTGM